MTSQDKIERRLAALFLVALALIAWQATRTRPLSPPDYVSVLEDGDQQFPIAVPNWEAPEIPGEPQARREFLAEHAVEGSPGAAPAPCDLFLRVSLHHWVHLSLAPSALASLSSLPSRSSVSSFRLLPSDFADDDDADGNSLDPGELHARGPGAEAEVYCRP